jgi:hypothetical protein
MTHSRLILSACLLVIIVAIGADGYAHWRKPTTVASTSCPHVKACPYCRGWDAFQAGKSLSDNPFGWQVIPEDRTLPGIRWQAGWEAGQRNSIYPIATAVDE